MTTTLDDRTYDIHTDTVTVHVDVHTYYVPFRDSSMRELTAYVRDVDGGLIDSFQTIETSFACDACVIHNVIACFDHYLPHDDVWYLLTDNDIVCDCEH